MKRLYIAVMAFYNIAFNKTHIYSTPIHRSVVAKRSEVIEMQNEITRMCNDDINQHSLLEQAKEILTK